MNILITGANGQLGRCIQDIAGYFPDFHCVYTDVDTLDITDIKQIEKVVGDHSIEIIINAAAYTAVDKAETEVGLAYALNEKAVENLAVVSNENRILLIHVSTDYVFDGKAKMPYTTDFPVNPVSVYGRSKAAGEKALFLNNPKSLIIRTSWLYSAYGNNFVKTMLRLASERDEIKVVNDQTGSPTYAEDLAMAILKIVEFHKNQGITAQKIYHFADEGVISWFDFASEIIKLAGMNCRISPISTSEYPTPAVRPKYSVFDLSEIKKDFNIQIPDWRDSLKKCFQKLQDLK